MQNKIQYRNLGLIEYKKAWDYQEKLFNYLISGKSSLKNVTLNNNGKVENTLILCEHPHVFTLGKRGVSNNLLINDEYLKKINATYFKTNRGGDITYHGPGQIVGYPIFDLEKFGIGVKQYIYNIEEVIISTLAEYNIESSRIEEATGVWLDKEKPVKARKICAIGVRASRYVTMHGFAFNINTDLNYFNYINPCGFIDKGITSIEKELDEKINIEEVKKQLIHKFTEVFKAEIILS